MGVCCFRVLLFSNSHAHVHPCPRARAQARGARGSVGAQRELASTYLTARLVCAPGQRTGCGKSGKRKVGTGCLVNYYTSASRAGAATRMAESGIASLRTYHILFVGPGALGWVRRIWCLCHCQSIKFCMYNSATGPAAARRALARINGTCWTMMGKGWWKCVRACVGRGGTGWEGLYCILNTFGCMYVCMRVCM